MTRQRMISIGVIAAVLLVGAIVWVAVAARHRALDASPDGSAAAPAASVAPPGRKIKARLYYVSTDGTKLTGVDREVPYGDDAAAQAQQIVSAQLAPVAAPYLSAIPPATSLRALYLDPKGVVFVDLSKEVSTAHTGGSQDELLTVYSIVNALTANLPAITGVQVLVDGKQVDTLAGHIDLRKPLQKNLAIIEPEATAAR